MKSRRALRFLALFSLGTAGCLGGVTTLGGLDPEDAGSPRDAAVDVPETSFQDASFDASSPEEGIPFDGNITDVSTGGDGFDGRVPDAEPLDGSISDGGPFDARIDDAAVNDASADGSSFSASRGARAN